MNKLFTVTFSSLVALGVGLAFMPGANAFTLSPTCQTKAVSSNTQSKVVDVSSETLIAYGVYCETRGSATCCVDSYGYWVCTY
ncbi:MAG: hypothetical protein AB4063_01180 [Crocosphaera sp.]